MNKLKKNLQGFRKSEDSAFLRKLQTIRYPILKLFFPIALLLLTFLLYKTGVNCVWKHFFGIPCAGCGMTRAFFALLQGDVFLSLKRHFMLFSLPIMYLYILFDGKLFKNKILNNTLLGLILLGFLIHWIIAIIIRL